MSKTTDRLKKFFSSWEFVLIVILVLEILVFGAKNPKFLKPTLFFNSMNDFMSICIISLFVTFVMITGGIDIQAGSIVGLTSMSIGVTGQDFGFNVWTAALLSAVVATGCGALSGFFVAYCGVQPMVVTLGGSFLYAGIALIVSNMASTAAYQGISGFPESFKAIAKTKFFGIIPSQLVIFIVLVIIAYILLHKSK